MRRRGGAIRVEYDNREVSALVIDLQGAPLRMQFQGRHAVRRGARLVEKYMKVDAAGHQGNWFGRPGTSYNTPLEKHVSSEMTGPLSAVIGVEAKGAGKLAHIIAFGSVNNAPAWDHTKSLRLATPEIKNMIAEAAEGAVLGRDG